MRLEIVVGVPNMQPSRAVYTIRWFGGWIYASLWRRKRESDFLKAADFRALAAEFAAHKVKPARSGKYILPIHPNIAGEVPLVLARLNKIREARKAVTKRRRRAKKGVRLCKSR